MDTTKPYYVYVLWTDLGQRHYIGVTEDVDTRLTQHNTGAAKWTKRYAGTWQLVWSEQQPDPLGATGASAME